MKGIRGAKLQFIVTKNEAGQAEKDSHFVLRVVTSALAKNRRVQRIRGKELRTGFDLEALAFRAGPRR